MKRTEFNELLRKLCGYYERKIPEKTTGDLWFGKVERYPDECLPWVTKTIGERFERFPANLPNVIRQLWREWINAHPEKQEYFRQCADPWCDRGEIHAVKVDDGGTVIVAAFACRICGQSRNAWPRASGVELAEQ